MNYDKNYFKNMIPKRPENSHKGMFGHVLNIAGSRFYTGAAYFSSISALKVGCGLVTLASEAAALQAAASLAPDIILFPVEKINTEFLKRFQAISIGCGLSTEKKAVKIFKKTIKLLKDLSIPVIIDADGLNILSGIKNSKLPQNIILTPHPKEMSRLIGVNSEEILKNPEHYVKECSKKYKCTTVLKLHKTLVADNRGNFYENTTGNSALSHGGSGDVLCGMISGFLAGVNVGPEVNGGKCGGVNAFEACVLGVFLHGLTAEKASQDLTEYSTLASDLINYIPNAIKELIDTAT